jgi:hypothetical protein
VQPSAALETLGIDWFDVRMLPPLSFGRVNHRQLERALARQSFPPDSADVLTCHVITLSNSFYTPRVIPCSLRKPYSGFGQTMSSGPGQYALESRLGVLATAEALWRGQGK